MNKAVRGWLLLIAAVLGTCALIIAAALVLARVVGPAPAAAASVQTCAPAPFPPAAPVVRLRKGDLSALAATVFSEAVGEGYCAMRAVASVVLNRMAADPGYWGRTVSAVVLKPAQFSAWNPSGGSRARLLSLDETDAGYLLAVSAAVDALAGAPDPTGGADHFHHAGMPVYPPWSKRMVRTVRIGSHIFYKGRGRGSED